MLTRLLLALTLSLATAQAGFASEVLFADPLDGSGEASAWRTPPTTFVDLPDGGRALRFERGATWETTATQPWAGNQTWREYRVEVDIRPEKMWAGIDFHVQDDASAGNELTVIEVPGAQLAIEVSGFWGRASAWKLWPVGQRAIPHEPGSWVRLRLDVAAEVVNVYANDDTEPFATFRDLPVASGGIRLAAYAGSALFRNLRVTPLPPGAVEPVLDDPWAIGRGPGVLRDWQTVPRQAPGFGASGIPPALTDGSTSWREAPTDSRGVVHLSSMVGPEAVAGVAFARTSVTAAKPGTRRAWVTYTDDFSLWCNGRLVFEGPPRQWSHPDREKHGNSRLIPDQYPIELPLDAGENQILVRTEVTEPTFGWGFWMRVAAP